MDIAAYLFSALAAFLTGGAFFGLFVLSMYGVFLASDALSLLLFWEAMSIASYFLIVTGSESDEARKAGLNYAIMTHIGTAFIIASFMAAFWASGSMDFEGMKAGLASAPPETRSAVFLLAAGASFVFNFQPRHALHRGRISGGMGKPEQPDILSASGTP